MWVVPIRARIREWRVPRPLVSSILVSGPQSEGSDKHRTGEVTVNRQPRCSEMESQLTETDILLRL